jgi:hypothetical protein
MQCALTTICVHGVADLRQGSGGHLRLTNPRYTDGKATAAVAVWVTFGTTTHLHPRRKLDETKV